METTQRPEIPVHKIVRDLVETNKLDLLPKLLADLHPADISEAISRLDLDQQPDVFLQLSIQSAPAVLAELDDSHRENLLNNLSDMHIIKLLSGLDSDDAADVIADLDEDRIPHILEALPAKDNLELKTLLLYDEETAGGIMGLEIVAVNQHCTAKEALRILRSKSHEVDDVYNIYAIDRRGVLRGFASLKDVVLAEPSTKISAIMDPELVKIYPDMDQEEVAHLFQKYDLVAAPVVDEANRLVGRITVDDIMDVVEDEASQDITMMAGITDEDISERSILKLSWVRLPWLLVAFAGELISAKIMESHLGAGIAITKIVRAAAFIPLIMAMGGNTGIQSATVVIRGLATGEFNLRDTGQRLLKEISVTLVNSLVISLTLFSFIFFVHHQLEFGIQLAIAMTCVLLIASFMGTMVPFLLKRIGIDPAVATGPFITTSNDVLGLLVYFNIIILFEKWF